MPVIGKAMSDNLNLSRSILGNSAEKWQVGRQGDTSDFSYSYRRPLVEETHTVDTRDLQRIYDRTKLLQAADEGQSVKIRLQGQHLEIFLTWESHPLPGRPTHWSDFAQRNVRLWLICTQCWRRVGKLYLHPAEAVSGNRPEPGCRKCLKLSYQSQHCGGNKWWKQFAMPLKRLLRQRRRLLLRQNPRSMKQLEKIDRSIWLLRERAVAKSRSRQGISHTNRIKRLYRDLALIR